MIDKPNHEFSLSDIIDIFLKVKNKIFTLTLLLTSISIIYALSLDDKYLYYGIVKSSDKLNIAESKSNFGAFSSLGVLGGSSSNLSEESKLALEISKSKDFFDFLLLDNNFLDYMLDKKAKVYSYEELHDIYLANLKIITNKSSPTVVIGFENTSPDNAYKLITFIIKSLNNYIRNEKVKNSKSEIIFLEKTLLQTSNPDIKAIISSLIEANIRKSMMSENANEYVFSYVDSPRIPENKTSPKRSLIVIIVFLLSFLASFFILICKEIINIIKNN